MHLNLQADRDTHLSMRGNFEEGLHQRIVDLTGRLEELSDSESQMTSQIDRYNRRLRRLESAVAKSAHPKEVCLNAVYIFSSVIFKKSERYFKWN